MMTPTVPVPSVAQIQAIGQATYTVFKPMMVPFEAGMRTYLPNTCDYLDNFYTANIHEYSRPLPLTSPYTIIFCILFYQVTLLALYLLSRVLPKLELRLLGIVHNLFLTVLSLYMCVGMLVEAVAGGYSLWNNPVSPPGPRREAMGAIMWVYVASKLPEFLDTFLMALKHNYRQITFLHVYHHSSVLVIFYCGLVSAPGGDMYWGAMLNSAVHVIMYCYYGLNLVFPSGPVREFLNRNKLLITYGQLLQFVLVLAQALHGLFYLPKDQQRYPPMLFVMSAFYMLTLIVLFMNFLIRQKLQRRGKRIADKAAAESGASPASAKKQK
jgi:elongation of very long chain fatty acids protein 4